MIISRAPLRISFVGGGTDISEFYEQHGGAVVWMMLDKGVHVVSAASIRTDVRVSCSRTEIVPTTRAVEHERVRNARRAASGSVQRSSNGVGPGSGVPLR